MMVPLREWQHHVGDPDGASGSWPGPALGVVVPGERSGRWRSFVSGCASSLLRLHACNVFVPACAHAKRVPVLTLQCVCVPVLHPCVRLCVSINVSALPVCTHLCMTEVTRSVPRKGM